MSLRGRALPGRNAWPAAISSSPTKPRREQVLLHPQRPSPMVGRGEIDARRQGLLGEPAMVDVPGAGGVSARCMASTRPSHFSWNGAGGLDLSLAETIHAAAVSCTPFATVSPRRTGKPIPIVEVSSRNEVRRSFAPPFGASRAHRQDKEARFGGKIPDADFSSSAARGRSRRARRADP